MKRLFLFFSRQSIFLLFLLLEMASFTLYVNNENYPKTVFFSSSNVLVSRLHSTSAVITEFVNLRVVNEGLSRKNTELENRLTKLESLLGATNTSLNTSLISYPFPEKEYEFITAKVINNSTNKLRNFITINRGLLDSIAPDMGVIAPEGVVGVVKTVSDHFAVVVPILNPMTQISCKIKENHYTGPLLWDGQDYRYASLQDIPRHVPINIGDSVVTSGLTSVFPEGVPVGEIEEYSISDGSAFYDIKIKLAVNFKVVLYVDVINYKNYKEQTELENEE